MTDLAKTYSGFWSKLLPSYIEEHVPPNTKLPYITYSLLRAPFGVNSLNQVRVWTRSSSYTLIGEYCDQIERVIPEAGTTLYLPDEKGALYLYRGEPFIQFAPMDEPEMKVAYINIVAKSFIY